jgi:hypothetical protein
MRCYSYSMRMHAHIAFRGKTLFSPFFSAGCFTTSLTGRLSPLVVSLCPILPRDNVGRCELRVVDAATLTISGVALSISAQRRRGTLQVASSRRCDKATLTISGVAASNSAQRRRGTLQEGTASSWNVVTRSCFSVFQRSSLRQARSFNDCCIPLRQSLGIFDLRSFYENDWRPTPAKL